MLCRTAASLLRAVPGRPHPGLRKVSQAVADVTCSQFRHQGRTLERVLEQAASELFQHEIDHLDGVLALDRALDKDAIVTRTAFDSMPEWFLSRVDYVIPAPG